MVWFPQEKEKLNDTLKKFMSQEVEKPSSMIHGLIVPHAGYVFSGKIAGKAFALLKNKKIEKAIVIGPSHYMGFEGIRVLNSVETPLGKPKIPENSFEKLEYEHSVHNQIPFLQKLNPNIEVLPLVVGELSNEKAKNFAEKISKINGLYVFSTDLSHFLNYDEATKTDKKSIEVLRGLNISRFEEIDACGKFSLLIMMHLCKLKNLKPHLIEYKNSGDVTGDKSQVVGYASFWF